MYAKIDGNTVLKYPYSIGNLRQDNPNVSFPKTISLEILAAYGVRQINLTDDPEYNSLTQKIVIANTPTKNADTNQWVLEKTVVNLTEEEIAANNLTTAETNRTTRNNKLAETDFYALSDVTMSSAMTTYRQALRDLPDHSNWPNLQDSDWPTKP